MLCRGKSFTSIGTYYGKPAAEAMMVKLPYCSTLGQNLRGAPYAHAWEPGCLRHTIECLVFMDPERWHCAGIVMQTRRITS